MSKNSEDLKKTGRLHGFFSSEWEPYDSEDKPGPWKDSFVDFREQVTVWLDRNASSHLDENTFKWKCRPEVIR